MQVSTQKEHRHGTLPAREDYYRPQRAQELRRQAEGLERSLRPFGSVFRWQMALLVLLCAAALCLNAICPLPIGSFIFPISTLVSMYLGSALPRRVEKLRAEADALEREHQSRCETPDLIEADG
jgi:hypothetical protein